MVQGPDQPRSFEKLHVQNGPSSPSKNSQPTLVCRVQSPCPTAPRQCQRLRIRILRPGRTRTFALAPAQHNIPVDGLFSFTLPCAKQNTWYLLAALWLRDQQTPYMPGPSKPWELDPSTRSWRVRALLIQATLSAPTITRRMPSWRRCRSNRTGRTHPSPRWPSDADFQLSPTQPVVRR